MNMRRTLLLITTVFVMLALAACGNNPADNSNAGSGASEGSSGTAASSAAAPSSGEVTEITMWTFLDPEKTSPRELALKQIIDNFEAANPDIKVKVEPQVWNSLATKFFMASGTGDAPDISWINTENLGGLIKTGTGADLNELFINGWSQEEEQDMFIRAGWDAALVDGKRYAVQIFPSAQNLYYRKDLFEQANIDPKSIKTWDQFIAAAQKLTKKAADGTVEVWGFGMPLSIEKADTNPFLYSLISLQGDAFKDGKPWYATEAGVQSLMLQANFVTRDQITPLDALTYSADEIVDQFAAGKYAIIIGPASRYETIQKAATWDPDALGILQMPNWTDERYGPATVKGWWAAVWKDSKHKEAAGKFVEYMISAEGQKIWGLVGGQIPVRLSVFNDPEFSDPKYAYMSELVDAWKAWSWINPTDLNMTGYESDISRATHEVIVDKKDPLKALEAAEKAFLDRQ